MTREGQSWGRDLPGHQAVLALPQALAGVLASSHRCWGRSQGTSCDSLAGGCARPWGRLRLSPPCPTRGFGAARRHLPGVPGGSALSSPTEGRWQDAGEPHPHGRGGSRGCPSCCIPQPSPAAPGAAGGGSPGSEPGWGTAAICLGARGLQAVAATPCHAASGDSRVTNEVNVPRAGAVTPR